jgi:hypothetical protein
VNINAEQIFVVIWRTRMIQAIEYEQTFVTNLEKFMGKADKFIKIYYSGMGEESHLREMMLLIKNLAIDADLQQ